MTYVPVGKNRALRLPTEHEEQKTFIEWSRTQYVTHPELRWLYAIPNQGGKGVQAIARGRSMKAEGLQTGYPDLGLDLARGSFHGLRIEMKKQRDSHLSEEQRGWAAWLIEQGYYWCLCFGWEKARGAVLTYLALPRPTSATSSMVYPASLELGRDG